jgi:hypothetical protein
MRFIASFKLSNGKTLELSIGKIKRSKPVEIPII